MARQRSTRADGASFDQATIEAVWRKAHIAPGHNPAVYRRDTCGAWISRVAYGTTGDYGWEVDHIVPASRGGTDEVRNLQPLQWQNNRGKGDDWPNWSCTLGNR
jgi:hypothetical protein